MKIASTCSPPSVRVTCARRNWSTWPSNWSSQSAATNSWNWIPRKATGYKPGKRRISRSAPRRNGRLLPGDAIVGYITQWPAWSIHRQDCASKGNRAARTGADHPGQLGPGAGAHLMRTSSSVPTTAPACCVTSRQVLLNERINVLAVNTKEDNTALMSLTIEIPTHSGGCWADFQLPNIIETWRNRTPRIAGWARTEGVS